jgi:predicted acyl esterase
MTAKPSKGKFLGGSIEGLDYKTDSVSGSTNKNGEFEFQSGETITFSIAGLVLGSTPAAERLTPADLVPEVRGDIKNIINQKVTNLTRFLLAISKENNIENGIVITGKIREAAAKYQTDINFDKNEFLFTNDPFVKTFCTSLGLKLVSGPQARNHLRRIMRGMRKLTDFKIPTRDGSYLLADITMPLEAGKYPVVMSLGAYGKAFFRGVICNEEDLLTHEDWEDKYFEGNPAAIPPFGKQMSENFELANTMDWVPRGYVVIRVDGRGSNNTPGLFQQFSLQESKDYYDAIEWAGHQLWSNGKVGLWGSSYYAIVQYNVAQLQPPSLKAMIPIGGDANSYRDYIFTAGGLYNSFNFVSKSVNGKWHGVDWISVALQHPFDDPAIYGPQGSLCISPDMNKVTVPFWSGLGIETGIHTRACSEVFINAASKNKKLLIISEPPMHSWTYQKPFLDDHIAFFDYWLKGIDNGIMKKPPVQIHIRTGRGGSYWQEENDWPVKDTKYVKYYLDASSSGYAGDNMRQDNMKLSAAKPAEEHSKAYPGNVRRGAVPPYSYGVSFVTDPLPEDVVIAGYLKLGIWVSSTTHDMELHAQVRVIDENNQDVLYTVHPNPMNALFPMAHGGLKVSHRKLDPAKSTVYRPYHTHQEKDYQPLKAGEIVEAEVELWPTTALIKKGHRIRLFVQPASGYGMQMTEFDAIDRTYQAGSTHTVYTGPQHLSYLQLPVIPANK